MQVSYYRHDYFFFDDSFCLYGSFCMFFASFWRWNQEIKGNLYFMISIHDTNNVRRFQMISLVLNMAPGGWNRGIEIHVAGLNQFENEAQLSFIDCFTLFMYGNLYHWLLSVCRHLGQGYSRSTKKCSERNQLTQTFNQFVMIPTYLNGLLLLRWVQF